MNLTPRADHAKCRGINCERREQCYRFVRPSHEYGQAWADWCGLYPGGERCTGFEKVPEERHGNP